MTINVDDIAADGEAGEGDNVLLSVEEVQGGAGADVMTAATRADPSALGSVLKGYARDDTLLGATASDDLNGGSGNDTLRGGALLRERIRHRREGPARPRGRVVRALRLGHTRQPVRGGPPGLSIRRTDRKIRREGRRTYVDIKLVTANPTRRRTVKVVVEFFTNKRVPITTRRLSVTTNVKKSIRAPRAARRADVSLA